MGIYQNICSGCIDLYFFYLFECSILFNFHTGLPEGHKLMDYIIKKYILVDIVKIV